MSKKNEIEMAIGSLSKLEGAARLSQEDKVINCLRASFDPSGEDGGGMNWWDLFGPSQKTCDCGGHCGHCNA